MPQDLKLLPVMLSAASTCPAKLQYDRLALAYGVLTPPGWHVFVNMCACASTLSLRWPSTHSLNWSDSCFHWCVVMPAECIDQWLVRDNTCPLCKNPVWTPPSSNKEPAAATAAAETTDAEALQREPAAALAPEGAVDEHLVDGQQPIEQQQSQQQLQQVVVVRDS